MAEHKALLKCTDCITDLLQHQVLSISSKLLEKGLTAKEVHGWVLTSKGVSDREKAARLVASVTDHVKSSPDKYPVFVGILKDEPFFEEAVKNLSSEYHNMSPEPDDILSRMEELDSKFRSLHQALLSELESKKVPVRKLVNSLTLLPIQLRQEYERAISSKLPDLRGEDEAGDVFRYHLNPLVNFLDYGLVRYVIDQFGSNTLKSMMTSYSDDIVVFMKKTTVKQLMDVWPGQQKIPRNFSKLRAKLDEDPTTYTLYQLDQLRRRFCCAVKLTEVVLVLIGLETANSFIVEWLIPFALIPQLMESAKKLDFGFYLRGRILKMSVDEKQIFPMLPDAKPKVPALQAAAATVTDLPEDQEPPVMELYSSVDQDTFEKRKCSLWEDLPEDQEPPITELSSSVGQLSLSSTQDREVQRIRGELRDCALYSGVGVICGLVGEWELMEPCLSSSDYKIISSLSGSPRLFTTIAQSIAYPKPPSVAESSPFVIAVFVSGFAKDLACHTIITDYGKMKIVDDLIQPFLPQLAPHLQHIPKLFFITAIGDPDAPPPRFPDDPDGNYCVAYHLATPWSGTRRTKLGVLLRTSIPTVGLLAAGALLGISTAASVTYFHKDKDKWANHITNHLFLTDMSVQATIENSRSYLDEDNECLHHFTCLRNKSLVLKK